MKRLIFIALLFLVSIVTYGQDLAFPTAQGAGKFARADVVYEHREVTNLNADGPGSLLDALGNNRIITYRVSGIIDIDILGANTRVFENCIILGQTAPFPGITIVSIGNKWRTQNLIMRYMRFRNWNGPRLPDGWGISGSADAIDFPGLDGDFIINNIIDHCSFAFGGDETLSFRADAHTATVQNSIISYGNAGALIGDSDDTSRGYDFSYLNNFFHSLGKRGPGNPNSNGRIDVIGNVVHDLKNQMMRTDGTVQLNEIGNYYRDSGDRNRMGGNPLVYTDNNRWINGGVLTNSDNNQILWTDWINNGLPTPSNFTNTMHPLLNYDEALPDGDDAKLNADNRVMGANAYLDDNGNPVTHLDDLDILAYNEFDNGITYDWLDRRYDPPQSSQSAWRTMPSRQWLPDNEASFGVIQNEHSQVTHVGSVPKSWITAQGLDPNTWNPVGNDLDPLYTNIEVYSFNVDGPIANTPVTGVTVSPSTFSISEQTFTQLSVVFAPTDASNKTGTWSSNNPSVATVSSSGLVTAVSEGSATITFTSNDNGFTDTSDITVTAFVPIAVTGVNVAPENLTLTVGVTGELFETTLPSNATDKTGVWSTDNAAIATVSSSGIVTGIAVGSATITFTTNDGGFNDSSDITVNEAADNLIINGTFDTDNNLTINNGWSVANGVAGFLDTFDNADLTFETLNLTAGDYTLNFDILNGGTNLFTIIINGETVVSQAAYPTSTGQSVSFTYSGALTNSLIIRARNAAGATAFELDNVILENTSVTIPVTGVTVEPSGAGIVVGNTFKLTSTVSPANADDTTGVWSTSDSNIATVSVTGLVTAVNIGTATITFTTTDGGLTDNSTITVTSPSNSNGALSKKAKTIIIGN